ncbi:hypothetical protein [Pusillimonas noertemannii]|uniref:Uncharacterized protein n=1 Tax=Pusillimonas noertemannii TaxID=305977 RepID=A0A2U1CMQ6_9BURK|nr:hypothetical protein [Pusillimonas noertemannii]NYT68703.1 hypothetical protein [Pusillimonas noertemannii]PVY62278.1 hypothetical protein C7440_1771 [Pusillimonas noertemannii]TFL10746.1 hypothetical protein CSC72_09505 [Pusillimonas noertemannii]
MANLFLIVLLLSLIALVLGIIKPKWSMPWAQAPKRWKSSGLYLLVAAVCFVGFGVSTDNEGSQAPGAASTASIAATAPVGAKSANTPTKPKPLTAKELVALRMPDAQKGFLGVMAAAAVAYDDAPNELVKSKIAKQRKIDSREFTPGSKLENWTGVIEGLQTNGDGKAIVSIRANATTTFKTWNNAFSDIKDGTLIPQASPLFDVLAGLSEGTPVSFSGFLASEGSATEQGSVRKPEFIVRFESIEPLL